MGRGCFSHLRGERSRRYSIIHVAERRVALSRRFNGAADNEPPRYYQQQPAELKERQEVIISNKELLATPPPRLSTPLLPKNK